MRHLLIVAALLPSACGPHSVARLLDTQTPAPAATADLLVSFSGPATVSAGKISFSLTLKNAGAAMTGEAPVKTKAMLFPKADYATKIVGKGLVLETIDTTLNLASGQETTVTVERLLPNIPKGSYFLGATTNTSASAFTDPDEDDVNTQPANAAPHLVELYDAQLNNVTVHMLDLGELEVLVPDAGPKGKYDICHEVQNGAIRFDAGTASHSSRNILRVLDGEDKLPPKADWRKSISARFLFADVEAGTLTMGAYTKGSIDKVWTGISWQSEKDAEGHDIYVDYYDNAPSIAHLLPGKYVLGVLSNVNDEFKLDAMPENNLDLTFMNLDKQHIIKMVDEVWVSVNDGDDISASASINGRGDLHAWSYKAANLPAWLKLEAKGGKYSYAVNGTLEAGAVPVGMTEVPVTVTATKDGKTFDKATVFKIFKNGGPVPFIPNLPKNGRVRAESEGVKLAEVNGVKTLSYEVTIQNAGSETLHYSLAKGSAALKANGPEKREIAPGQSHKIALTLVLVGIAIPRDDGTTRTYFGFELKTNGGSRYIDLYFEQGVANGQADGDDDDDDDNGDDDLYEENEG